MTTRYRHSKMMDPVSHGEHKAYGSTTYRQIQGPEGKLAKRESFKGNSMRGVWTPNFYLVYSYDQLIAKYVVMTGELILDPNELYGYSPATSRHINLCRAWMKGYTDGSH